MMELDVVLLSRIQFALTIMFHYLFPPLTIGLAMLIVIFEGMHLKTNDPLWKAANKFWVRLFAVTFAVGVATGIVMEFQFGTNWAAYSRFVGDVFGSALAAEGIFAFFLESGFLAVLVFGRDRVGRKFYFFSACMVSLGSIFSSVWIVIANSWQQTPAGSHIVQMSRDGRPWFIDGQPVMRAEIVDFWQVVFNPSTVNRLTHVWTGAMILGGLFVLSICAFYVLRNRHLVVAQRCFRVALVFTLVGSVAAVVTGDSNARMVARYQPAKLAAFEGHLETGDGPTGLHLFGIPSLDGEKIYLPVEIPGLLSVLVYREIPPETPVIGLDQFHPDDRPPVAIPFITFHLMVAIGTLLPLLCLLGVYFWWRGTLWRKRWLMWLFVFAVLGGFVANEAGWVTAEVGRQPWIVHPTIVRDDTGRPTHNADGFIRYELMELPGVDGAPATYKVAGLRTRDAHSASVVSSQVLGSIIMFSLIYVLLFFVWVYVLDTKIKQGPPPEGDEGEHDEKGFLDVASSRADRHGSMTGIREDSPNDSA